MSERLNKKLKPSIASNRSPWLTVSLAFASIFILGIPVSNGELVHRYFFSEQSTSDLVGKEDGQSPSIAEFDAIKFSEEVPKKATGVSLDLSQVGKDRLSGVTLRGSVLSAKKGAYALWIRPAQEVADEINHYIIGSVPLLDGITLVIRSRSGVIVHAKGSSIGPASLAPANTWHHIAVVWDATNDSAVGPRAELYVDGDLVGTVALKGMVAAQRVICGAYILKYEFGSSGQSYSANQYRGLIYDLQIYGDSLMAGQVKQLYENPGMAFGEISEKLRKIPSPNPSSKHVL